MVFKQSKENKTSHESTGCKTAIDHGCPTAISSSYIIIHNCSKSRTVMVKNVSIEFSAHNAFLDYFSSKPKDWKLKQHVKSLSEHEDQRVLTVLLKLDMVMQSE